MALTKAKSSSEYLSYKGYPLLRKDNIIYFGNTSDKFVVMIQILQTEKIGDLEVANKVRVLRMLTDKSLPADKLIDKSVDKNSLFEALDIASTWLERLVG